MQNTDDLTVVMATRNRREQALRACRALAELPERPAIIVVDNGSTDGTADALQRALPQLTVVRLDRNAGAVARTVGVQRASTPLVAFADDDSGWQPGALSRAAACFAAHPRLAVLAARVLVGDDARPDPLCALLADSPLGRAGDLPGPSVLGFLACGAVVRRRAYLSVGGFHPVLFFYGEESLLAQDLTAAGWGVAYVAEVVATHHPLDTGDRAGRRRAAARSEVLSALLRRPLPVTVRRTLHLLPGLPDRQVRAGLLDAARCVPAALAARTPLPPEIEAQARRLEVLHA